MTILAKDVYSKTADLIEANDLMEMQRFMLNLCVSPTLNERFTITEMQIFHLFFFFFQFASAQ